MSDNRWDDGRWKTETQHAAGLRDGDQARYSRLVGLYALWTAISFALPVAIAAIYVIARRMGVLDHVPIQFRFNLTWLSVAKVALAALPVHVVGALLLRRRMKRIVAEHLESQQWR